MAHSSGSYILPDESVLSKKVYDGLIDYRWSTFCSTPLKNYDECNSKLYTLAFEENLEKKFGDNNFLVKIEHTYTNNELTAVEIEIKSLSNEKMEAKVVMIMIADHSNKFNKSVRKCHLNKFCKNLPLMLTKGNILYLEVVIGCIRKLFSAMIYPLPLSTINMKQILNRFLLRDGKSHYLVLEYSCPKIKDFSFTVELPIEEMKAIFAKIQLHNNQLDLDEKSSKFYDFIHKAVSRNTNFEIENNMKLENFALPCLKIFSETEFTVYDSKTAYDFCEFLYNYVLTLYAPDY